jgi:hypothetical protein
MLFTLSVFQQGKLLCSYNADIFSNQGKYCIVLIHYYENKKLSTCKFFRYGYDPTIFEFGL